MPIASLADLNAAYADGRWHSQRYLKTGTQSPGANWADPSFSSGQPAFDPRIGVSCAFTPAVASKNDAVWFPSVADGLDRYLHTLTLRSNATTYAGPGSVLVFDLLGYYPLVDGDSVDEQVFDNTLTLPRCVDGERVALVIVSHVAPPLVATTVTINFTDSDGVDRTTTVGLPLASNGYICSGVRNAAATDVGPVTVALGEGVRGVRKINSVTYSAAPGGLHCYYLVRILGSITLGDNALAAEKDFFMQSGCSMPVIDDGAWLGFFNRAPGTTSAGVSWFGQFTFVWG